MTVCAVCSRELQPEWKYCIYCGTRTGVPLTVAIDVITPEVLAAAPPPAVETVADPSIAPAAPVAAPAVSVPTPAPAPVAPVPAPVAPLPAPAPAAPLATPASATAAPATTSATTPGYDNTDTGVLRIEDIPSDEEAAPAAAPDGARPAKVNVLAIIALVLGCLAIPLAALFGHIALSQIGRSGDRGTAIAWVAVVLGYLSLAALLVIGISYFVLNA